MEQYEKTIPHEHALNTLDKAITALRKCAYPLISCPTDCPFYKEASGFRFPLGYCTAVISGDLAYVRKVMEGEV